MTRRLARLVAALTPLSLVLLVLLALFATGPALAAEPQKPVPPIGVQLDNQDPIEIRSVELEARRAEDGRERVVFRGSVRVKQGDLRIRCDWLEATYGTDGAGGPEKIVARGSVRILQQGNELHCTDAVFDRASQRLICTSSAGPATLLRGDDVVEGDEIRLDLAKSVIRVVGSARVRVRGEKSEASE